MKEVKLNENTVAQECRDGDILIEYNDEYIDSPEHIYLTRTEIARLYDEYCKPVEEQTK